MKIFERIMNHRKRQESIEKRLARQTLEIYELRRELAKMSTEIARLKAEQNKQEEETHGREQKPSR